MPAKVEWGESPRRPRLILLLVMRSQRGCILDQWEPVADGDVSAENVVKRILHGSYVL